MTDDRVWWDEIRDLGYDVYVHPTATEFCYYSDGTNVGYAQFNRLRGYSVGTVHVPNRETGTGFNVARETGTLTPEILRNGFKRYSGRVTPEEAASVVKFSGPEAFLASNSWHSKFEKLPSTGPREKDS